MPAKIKIYYDEDCKQEVTRDNTTGYFIYTYFKLKEDGTVKASVDGIKGEDIECSLYLKNVGTRAALKPRITFISTNNQEMITKKVYVGQDIPVNKVEKINIEFSIKAWTAAQISENNFTLDYYSLPDTVTYTNPYNQYAAIAEETNTYVDIEGI